MGAEVSQGEVAGSDELTILDRVRALGLSPQAWRNAAGETYGWHEHAYRKILFCVSGSLVFHTEDGDLHLVAAWEQRLARVR